MVFAIDADRGAWGCSRERLPQRPSWMRTGSSSRRRRLSLMGAVAG